MANNKSKILLITKQSAYLYNIGETITLDKKTQFKSNFVKNILFTKEVESTQYKAPTSLLVSEVGEVEIVDSIVEFIHPKVFKFKDGDYNYSIVIDFQSGEFEEKLSKIE